MSTSLIVAIIAALVSLTGAGLAYRSANGARESVDRINSLNHQIAVIDRDAEELRSSYRALASLGGGLSSPEVMRELVGSAEMLRACRATNSDLDSACEALSKLAANHVRQVDNGFRMHGTPNFAPGISKVRVAYKRCQTDLEDKRRELLGTRNAKPMS